jgi:hypothetical protein
LPDPIGPATASIRLAHGWCGSASCPNLCSITTRPKNAGSAERSLLTYANGKSAATPTAGTPIQCGAARPFNARLHPQSLCRSFDTARYTFSGEIGETPCCITSRIRLLRQPRHTGTIEHTTLSTKARTRTQGSVGSFCGRPRRAPRQELWDTTYLCWTPSRQRVPQLPRNCRLCVLTQKCFRVRSLRRRRGLADGSSGEHRNRTASRRLRQVWSLHHRCSRLVALSRCRSTLRLDADAATMVLSWRETPRGRHSFSGR